ncbi:mechanosensitive ion channel protein MscS, partial [Francisella tularensis]|nr:mechanosensitive ion channel protein MscS [Francisella tularensis]
MNLLNNILLRVENYSTTYILLIDFVICLVLSVIISLLG